MKQSKIALALALSVSALFLSACNDSDAKDNNASQSFVSEKPYTFDKVEGAASTNVMTYKMVNVQGKLTDATALVIFPTTPQPKDGYRVVVWEHGTLGVTNNCAPTVNKLGTNFKDPLAKSLLAAGYVIVAPDYEGLGGPGIHPYLHLSSEAKSAISAVQAAKEHYGSKLNNAWMSIGQSQGGQASLGTAQYANTDVNYKGAVAGAPASGLDSIIFKVAPTALAAAEKQELAANLTPEQRVNGSIGAYSTLLSYAALAAVGIKASEPRFDYTQIFKGERSANIAKLAEGSTGELGMCLSSQDETKPEDGLRAQYTKDIVAFLKEDPNHKLSDYPGLDQDKFYASPEIKQFLKDSQPGTTKIDKPILVIQGTADMSVPYVITDGLVKNMKAAGSNIEILPVDKATHTEAIVWKNADAVNFIKKYMPAN